MIQVDNLTKRYAGVTALNGVSFTVGRGEIVGFLGRNGAGKSTTMRILSGFIPATSGRATVAGWDVFEHSLEVRRHIGYMPENNPLYVDMRVVEYLKFRARLKGLAGSRRAERVTRVLEMCGLRDVQRRVIGQLSKGYRQRVGLADALLTEPDLLILDEPTIGLDPVQIRQVRELIKSLGQQHTILISTHILPEVEMTCNRVVIIHRGRILKTDTIANLVKPTLSVEVIGGAREAVQAAFRQVPGIEQVSLEEHDGERTNWSVREQPGIDAATEIFEVVKRGGWKLRELSRSRTALEEIFVTLLREEDEAEEDRREQRGRVR